MAEHDENVRELAYRLWEQAGRPHGRDEEFWHAAQEELRRPATDAPAPRTEQRTARPEPEPAAKKAAAAKAGPAKPAAAKKAAKSAGARKPGR